ncbi:uncharacterized protein LOC126746421 [Anthonomus grandis grandis]|uniref:uncharacterized protein LOC126746421 n=1 Tax=Anthonomus grandis grandis TaxID=2921223 RepID=UPI002165BD06|nr:uncharacterized protein LOC126746421 [Anthonomus grandis grandis]
MGFSTVSQIINEVCDAIWKHLQPIYMPEPSTELWERTISRFENSWQFPNCIGSIDGKHVAIKCPPNSGSNYYCYLKKFSIVLLAIVDHEYKFVCVDVGGYGKNSDGGIFEASSFGQRMSRGLLNIPPNRALPGQNEETPCVLIGDEAFALTSFLMRPFPYRLSRHDIRKEKYNKRLCRVRRVVENAFGILAQKWRLFYRPLELKVETSIKVIKATCVLHNYLRTEKRDLLFSHLLEDAEPIIGALDPLPADGRRATNYSFQIRENFVNFFNT